MDQQAADDGILGTRRAMAVVARGGEVKLVRAQDLVTLLKLPPAALVAWALPEPWWDRLAAAVIRCSGSGARDNSQRLGTFPGSDELGRPAGDVLQASRRNVRVVQAQYLRSYHPRGWRPCLRVEGREHLDRALGAGRGAIVWVAPFVFAPLVTKMALCAAGYELVHLSRLGHGYSPTRFGVQVLNPVRTRIENRYLAERVVIGESPLPAVMRTLAQRLAANRVVSITVVAQGVKTCAVPFLGGELRVATGAPNLMLRTGATLLPTFTMRDRPGRFLTVIEPPLNPRPAAGREQALQDLVEGFVARMEHHTRRCPDQVHWHPQVVDWRPTAG